MFNKGLKNSGAPSSLRKLDQVQARAEKLSNKIFQELGDRRLAAVFGFFCKLTGTDTCINSLSVLCPEIESKKATGSRRDDGRSFKLKSKLNQNRSFSLENFKRSFMGEVERVFDLLPTEIINEGINKLVIILVFYKTMEAENDECSVCFKVCDEVLPCCKKKGLCSPCSKKWAKKT